MRQLDWVTGCPGIWSNVVLGVSVRVFLDDSLIQIGKLSKADCSLWFEWALPNLSKA